MLLDSKHSEASFSSYSTDLPCLRVAKVPRSQDLAIFLLTMMTMTTTEPITLPLAHACGVTSIKGEGSPELAWIMKRKNDNLPFL